MRSKPKAIISSIFAADRLANVPIVVVSGGAHRLELANAMAATLADAGYRLAVVGNGDVRYAGVNVPAYRDRVTAVRAK